MHATRNMHVISAPAHSDNDVTEYVVSLAW